MAGRSSASAHRIRAVQGTRELILNTANVRCLTTQWSKTTGGSVASAAVSNGVAYVGSHDGKVYALNA